MSNSPPWLPLPSRMANLGILLISLAVHGLLLKLPVAPPPSPGLQPEAGPVVPRLPTVAVVPLPPAPPPSTAPLQALPSSSPAAAPVLPSPPPAPEPADPPPPIGPTYNHQARALTTNTESFLDWYGQQDWSSLELAPLPGPETLPPLRLSYGLGVCLDPAPAPGRLEVIVDASGALVRSPRLLASTGYDPLDAAALEQARQTSFSQLQSDQVPNPRVYWLPLEVQYDPQTCASGPP
ncbi:MAG: energy transducer TonB [Nodosilinea sp.]